MKPSAAPIVLLALAALMGPAVALAAPPESWLGEDDGGAPSSAQAAEQARRQTGGRVLSVQEKDGGYEVKVLTTFGEVRSVFIPGSER